MAPDSIWLRRCDSCTAICTNSAGVIDWSMRRLVSPKSAGNTWSPVSGRCCEVPWIVTTSFAVLVLPSASVMT
ncbi:hypothetical protein D3C85_1125650 [compost metagenome]